MQASKNDKQVARWLMSGIILVALMLILGSVTRLTNSGLSMVTWKPITGAIPPLNELQWQEEFSKYKTSPEYIKLNYHFDLNQFKEIFLWEYSHRLLGRVVGLVFFFPFVYFLIQKKIKSKKLLYHLLAIFFLGGMQGVIGWFMLTRQSTCKSLLVSSTFNYSIVFNFLYFYNCFEFVISYYKSTFKTDF